MHGLFLTLALCASWSDRVAIADAVVTARINALPELPDSFAPKPGPNPGATTSTTTGTPTPVPPPATGPVVRVAPARVQPRDQGPEVEVRMYVRQPCEPCDRFLIEIKRGGGRRQIRWAVQDYGYDGPMPYFTWTARGRLRSHTGFVTRAQLEDLIRRTENGE